MINMQEQMQAGFTNISREIRSLSSSVQPQDEQLIEDVHHNNRPRGKVIKDYDDDYHDESDEDSIVEIKPEYEDSYVEQEVQFVDEDAQKQFVNEHRKKIRVCFICFILICFYYFNIYLLFINLTFLFG
jgi:hypothetical protein